MQEPGGEVVVEEVKDPELIDSNKAASQLADCTSSAEAITFLGTLAAEQKLSADYVKNGKLTPKTKTAQEFLDILNNAGGQLAKAIGEIDDLNDVSVLNRLMISYPRLIRDMMCDHLGIPLNVKSIDDLGEQLRTLVREAVLEKSGENDSGEVVEELDDNGDDESPSPEVVLPPTPEPSVGDLLQRGANVLMKPADILAVAGVVGISKIDIRYIRENGLVPDTLSGNTELILALKRRAVGLELDKLKNWAKSEAGDTTRQPKYWLDTMNEIMVNLDKFITPLLSGSDISKEGQKDGWVQVPIRIKAERSEQTTALISDVREKFGEFNLKLIKLTRPHMDGFYAFNIDIPIPGLVL